MADVETRFPVVDITNRLACSRRRRRLSLIRIRRRVLLEASKSSAVGHGRPFHHRVSSRPPIGSRPYRRARASLCIRSRSAHGGSHREFQSVSSVRAS
jgi:hypothetical protein